jgi:alpha-mannosidase
MVDWHKEFVDQGRLVIGPWYALMDEFMVNPEALICNLQLGIHMGN